MTAPAGGPPRLAVRKVAKRFGGVVALDGVDFDVRAGEVHALCGENGAGKSTLIKILAGVHRHGSYSGSIQVDGHEVQFHDPRDAHEAGIAVIHQELALVEELSVAENLFLGALPRRGPCVDWDRVIRETRSLLERFGMDVDPETPVRELGVGRKQQLEILRAIRRESRVLILDEPTAALGGREAEALLDLVRRLAGLGVACIYITHRLDEVRAIADRVTVLRDGRGVASFDTGRVPPGELIRAMAGRPVSDSAPQRRPTTSTLGRVVLEVAGLDAAEPDRPSPRLRGIHLAVREGEVLGLAGMVGSGRSELLMHLYGAWGQRLRGEVRLLGRGYDDPSPERSLARGLALLSEDRRRLGLFADRSVAFNLTISSLARMTRHRWLDLHEENRTYRETEAALKVRSTGPETPMRALSGGNQQKVLLGRVLLTEPRILLLDEPTRGVDVATKFEIYARIDELTREGRAVVLVTSELPELLGLSDRILVLREGGIVADLTRDHFDQVRILALAVGHEEGSPG
ncbi:MAG: sugar ABC transporter ATP-binding protein [Isosphaeraceae bacterium]